MTDTADGAGQGLAALRFLVGGYTASRGGNATGISLVEADTAGDLAARTIAVVDNPSFLVQSGDSVFAVSEAAEGSVHAFRRHDATLEHRWDAPSHGADPCHAHVDPSGVLLLANYSSGSVGAVALEPADVHAESVLHDGTVAYEHGAETRAGAPVLSTTGTDLPHGSGPVVTRQEQPHAHQVVPGRNGTVLVSDLGGDAIHEYRIGVDDDGAPVIDHVRQHALPAGTGPRHMAWWGDRLLVSGELDGRVHRLQADADGVLHDVESAPAFDGPVGETLLSHIEVDDTGRVYVAARGRDTIRVLDAAQGLRRLAEVPCGGSWPRHFARVGGFLLVANERSDGVAVLPLDQDGIPGVPVAVVPVGTPTCIVPIA
ncbi:beta-propeller fold lactonase family protein [Curtobacterium sp. MCBD17_019]|uniref:lactonase family protein n=1 Tax=Curtobacterium sp. MCBD17_019 TaxID=2175669 RepID=UPI000DA7058D|nr:beta-propeller fold lactonase family protein [Curtobacterium sp. MCBD17_019]PZE78363.1 hypothetical protein DEI82_00875 [Curtobacterium sp. MCBD17_019]